MIARIVLWSLADTDATIGELREYLREEPVDASSEAHGLLFKAGISDESSERWGTVHLFASPEAADQPVPSRVEELIGKRPDLVEEFDVEGTLGPGELARLGRAFESRS